LELAALQIRIDYVGNGRYQGFAFLDVDMASLKTNVTRDNLQRIENLFDFFHDDQPLHNVSTGYYSGSEKPPDPEQQERLQEYRREHELEPGYMYQVSKQHKKTPGTRNILSQCGSVTQYIDSFAEILLNVCYKTLRADSLEIFNETSANNWWIIRNMNEFACAMGTIATRIESWDVTGAYDNLPH
jgi:hypothetical protein